MSQHEIGKSLHANNPKHEVTVYNSKGVMTCISFEDINNAIAYYNKAINQGYHATLIFNKNEHTTN